MPKTAPFMMIATWRNFIVPLAAAVFTVVAAPAHAQTRVFVGALGADSNSCSFAAPCRTFQHAHDVLPAGGGVIDVLDPSRYGSITITKPIDIQGHGIAEISPGSGHDGITINAGANDAILLTGVLVNGAAVGGSGIVFNTGKSLSVENCIVRNFTSAGLRAVAGVFTISNSSFADNTFNGILLQATGGTITAAIDRTVMSGNGFTGLNLIGQGAAAKATVTDSIAANNLGSPPNGSVGFFVQAAGAKTTLVLTRSTAMGNEVGIQASGTNGAIRIGGSVVTENTTGFTVSSPAQIFTYQDNIFDDNGTPSGGGTLTLANPQ
jgi:hypothetical protein